MNVFLDKKKLIQILFGFSIFLLVANLIATKIYESESPAPDPKIFTAKEIQQSFLNILSDFAVEENWIKNRSGKNDSINSYLIDVPSDLPITLIIKDIYNSFNENAVITSEEKKINNNTIIKIYSADDLKLSAEFRYNKNIFRKAENIGLFLADLFRLNEDEIIEVLNSTEQFAVLVTPSKKAEKLTDSISFYRKEYAVLLDDNITELDYKLSENYSENRLKISFRNMIGNFSKAIFFVIDDKSNLYASSLDKFIKEQLDKRNIRLVRKSEIKEINYVTEAEMIEELNNVIMNNDESVHKLIVIPPENLIALQKEIVKYRKIGYRFLNPSEIVFKKEN